MERITKKYSGKFYITEISNNDLGYYGEAIDKLANLEDMIAELIAKQEELSLELEKLRNSGDTKSYKFREILGHKLINSSIIATLESHHLM